MEDDIYTASGLKLAPAGKQEMPQTTKSSMMHQLRSHDEHVEDVLKGGCQCSRGYSDSQ
jgi:hypothetical protein